MSNVEIRHCGVVVRVDEHAVYVRMTVSSACGNCQARSVCGVDESADRIVEVETPECGAFAVGDEVEVALGRRSMGIKSVVLAYVVPFFVLSLLLVTLIAAGTGEGVAALGAVCGVAVYYILLYFLRSRIGKTIKFTITKQTK